MGDGRRMIYVGVTATPDNPFKAGVGYKVRIKESDGKWHVGKLHKYRPSDKLHFVTWPDGDGHWANLALESWEWEGPSPSTGEKPKEPPKPASQNPVHAPSPAKSPGGLIQMSKPNHLELDHAQTRFDSAYYKRAGGNLRKAMQYIDNRTKATKTAEKLNAWYFMLRESDGFGDSAHKALKKLREMGYEGFDAARWRG